MIKNMRPAVYPDDASPEECLAYLKMCLGCHEDDVRVVGNLRIRDALRGIQALEARTKEAEAVCEAAHVERSLCCNWELCDASEYEAHKAAQLALDTALRAWRTPATANPGVFSREQNRLGSQLTEAQRINEVLEKKLTELHSLHNSSAEEWRALADECEDFRPTSAFAPILSADAVRALRQACDHIDSLEVALALIAASRIDWGSHPYKVETLARCAEDNDNLARRLIGVRLSELLVKSFEVVDEELPET